MKNHHHHITMVPVYWMILNKRGQPIYSPVSGIIKLFFTEKHAKQWIKKQPKKLKPNRKIYPALLQYISKPGKIKI